MKQKPPEYWLKVELEETNIFLWVCNFLPSNFIEIYAVSNRLLYVCFEPQDAHKISQNIMF